MIRRLLALSLVSLVVLALGGVAGGQEAGPGAVVVAEVEGPMDQRLIDFVVETIEASDAQLVVLQIDSPGIASGDPSEMYDAIRDAGVATAAWVGPDPSVAFGGAALLLEAVDVSGAAPGVEIGLLEPVVHRSAIARTVDVPGTDSALVDTVVEVGADGGPVDVVQPTIGQFIAALDGWVVDTARGELTLETAREETAADGSSLIVPSTEVRFVKPSLVTRFLRLASRPEATFFYLVVGVAAAAFEFYAAGAGITAAVAAVALFLAGYGLATLPMNWGSFGLVLLGLILYAADFQKNQLGWKSIAGTLALLWGGFMFTTASPQFGPRWWAVIATVAGAALFYAFALTTIARSRFSTRTIGREYLVGRRGIAETDFDPEGTVVVDGARWRARAHRAAGLGPGDPIEVVEVKGILLEVAPPLVSESDAESVRE